MQLKSTVLVIMTSADIHKGLTSIINLTHRSNAVDKHRCLCTHSFQGSLVTDVSHNSINVFNARRCMHLFFREEDKTCHRGQYLQCRSQFSFPSLGKEIQVQVWILIQWYVYEANRPKRYLQSNSTSDQVVTYPLWPCDLFWQCQSVAFPPPTDF